MAFSEPDPHQLQEFLAATRQHESGGNYQAGNSRGGAYGAYQYIDSTWAGYGGYSRASLAPPAVQDAKAAADATAKWKAYGNWKQVAMAWYYPAWVNDPSKWNQVPMPGAGNNLTLGAYGDTIVAMMKDPNLGAQPSSGSSGGGAQPNATQQPAGSHFRLPAGGSLFKVNGVMVVVYRVGDTLVYYDGSEPGISARVDTTGIPFAGTMTGQQFAQLAKFPGGLVHGGVWSELSAPDLQQAGSYNSWVQHILTVISGGNTAWLHDNGVMQLMLQVAAGNISTEEMLAKLKQTDYWKSRTENQRSWEQKSPADQKLSIADQAAQLLDTYFAVTGKQIGLDDKTLQSWAQKIASGQSTLSIALNTWLRPIAVKDPNSPWSRQLESELENQRQRGVDISNEEGRVRDLYKQWGINVDDATVTKTASGLVTKTMSEEQLLRQLQQQASVLYPGKPADMDTSTWAQPWVSTYQRVMEQPGDLTNGSIAKALQNGQIPYEFEKELKQSDAWLSTTNGRQANTQAFTEVARRFGMVK